MIGILTTLGLSQRVAAKVAPWAAFAVIALLALLSVKIWDHFDDREAVRVERLEANDAARDRQVEAETDAAAERARNMVTNHQQTGDFHGAIHSPHPDDSSDPAVRLACQQLRNDGQDTAAISECGGR